MIGKNVCDSLSTIIERLKVSKSFTRGLAENMALAKPEPEETNPVPTNLKKSQLKPRGGGFVDGWR